jgi:hypothetical protein
MEWHTKEQTEAVGTLSQPPPSRKDKLQIPRSHCKKPTTKIILPFIPDGVQVGPELLGHVMKLKYLDHDLADKEKFLKLSKRLYMETVGTSRSGEPLDQPQKIGILGLVDLPHFGKGQHTTTCIK